MGSNVVVVTRDVDAEVEEVDSLDAMFEKKLTPMVPRVRLLNSFQLQTHLPTEVSLPTR